MKKFLLSMMMLAVVFANADAKWVSGTVHCGGKGLRGVLVTDGSSFTRTDSKGEFSFDISDNAEFVHIVTPAGYVADYSSGTPVFYHKADASKYDFDLKKTGSQSRYTMFSISDPQIRNKEQFGQFCGAPFNDLKAQGAKYKENGPVVGVVLGDLGWDKNLPNRFAEYKKKMAEIGFPVYSVTGNHDYNKERQFSDYSKDYFQNFGPHNYAFFMGKDLYIGLNNIMYIKEKQYKEGYSEQVLEFVEQLLRYIPKDTHIFIAQHSPIAGWHGNIINADRMLALLDGRKVDILSGHSHVMNNYTISPTVMDHNAPSICGSWWSADWCRDGVPAGYEIFNVKGKKISWFYHSIGKSDDYQVEIIAPGQSKFHPNSVIANVWDYDPEWTVTWSQDGKDMGPMTMVQDCSPTYIKKIEEFYAKEGKDIPSFKKPKKNIHYFAATPDQYAKVVTVNVRSRFGKEWRFDVKLSDYVDVQAHRGGAGLWPENTFTSMTKATEMGVNTLELDLQISQDGKVVVSHDAYFHSRYATRPDGSEVKSEDPKEYLYTMPYSTIAKYDVGKRPSTVWPGKEQSPAIKPLATELIDSVENYVKANGLDPMRYNIEIKCRKGKDEGKNWPEYHEFVDKCMELLLSKNLGDRLVVQCFDARALNYMHEKYPQVKLSYLISKEDTDWETYMGKLNFTPEWLSPEFVIVDQTMVDNCRKAGIRLVPWTVDNEADIRRILDLHVEAIITNYPDRVLKISRGY